MDTRVEKTRNITFVDSILKQEIINILTGGKWVRERKRIYSSTRNQILVTYVARASWTSEKTIVIFRSWMVSMQMRWTTVGRYSSEDKVVHHLLYIYAVYYVARNSCFTVQDDRFADNIGNNNSVRLFSLAETAITNVPVAGILKPLANTLSRGIGENDIKRIPSAVIVPRTRGDWGSSNDLSVRSVSINFVAYYTTTQHRTWNTVHLLDDAYMADSLPSFYQLDSRRSLIISGLQCDLVAVNVPCS